MPRAKKPPRLITKTSKATGKKFFIIRYEGSDYGTGCTEDQVAEAEVALRDFMEKTELAESGGFQRAADTSVARILSVYIDERAPKTADPSLIYRHVPFLNEFFGSMQTAQINGAKCREYVEFRTTPAMARRELETLRAAINHFKKQYGLDYVPSVTMPEKSIPRQRHLTRAEAARLLMAARRTAPHLARFILIGMYTGSRSGVIKSLRWDKKSTSAWIDVQAGVLHRRGEAERETKKRRPSSRIPRRLMAHMRRWHRIDRAHGIDHVISYAGQPVDSIRKAFSASIRRAGLEAEDSFYRVTPHTLRHTAVTWMMQKGIPAWDVAGSVGMTIEMLQRVYGHHDPNFQASIEDAF